LTKLQPAIQQLWDN